MANPKALRPSFGRIVRLQETRQWFPATLGSASIVQPRIAASAFSTSAAHAKRTTRDNNRLRGVSTMRRSGPREPLSVSWEEIPKPANYKPEVVVDPNHGLWEFFYGKKLLQTPAEDESHGRAWEAEELRRKSWEDLHQLWYVCLKERNRIATANKERTRRQLGFGEWEAYQRNETVLKTMMRIKHVLTERYYLWEDSRKAAQSDPDIDFETRPMYTALHQIVEDTGDESSAMEESLVEGEVVVEEASVEQKAGRIMEAEDEVKLAEAEKAPDRPKAVKKAAKPVDMPMPKF